MRTREPQRRQGIIRFEMPEDTLPATRKARTLWELSGTLDVRAFTRKARAVEGHAGRSILTNAHFKTRFGFEHVLVLGTAKVTCVVLLASLAFNLLQRDDPARVMRSVTPP